MEAKDCALVIGVTYFLSALLRWLTLVMMIMTMLTIAITIVIVIVIDIIALVI